MSVEFRRTTNPAPAGAVRRKGVLLLMSISILIVLILLVIRAYQIEQPALIQVYMQTPNRYFIDNDTTNFDRFASTLREAAAQQDTYHIQLRLAPNTANTDSLRAVMQVISAFDVPWQLKQ